MALSEDSQGFWGHIESWVESKESQFSHSKSILARLPAVYNVNTQVIEKLHLGALRAFEVLQADLSDRDIWHLSLAAAYSSITEVHVFPYGLRDQALF